jgi:hypothetical protein
MDERRWNKRVRVFARDGRVGSIREWPERGRGLEGLVDE